MTTSAPQAFARTPDHPVDALFVNRWSPRSYRVDAVPRTTLESMLEAARWAPSSSNHQPWRFYLTSGPGPTRDAWNEAINAWNRSWSDKAPVLVWVVARTTLPPNEKHPIPTPNRHALYDTGAAVIQFILEGERHGVKAHQMGGIDASKAHQLLGLDADHEVVCALAVGFPGSPEALPEGLKAREHPNTRKPIGEFATFV